MVASVRLRVVRGRSTQSMARAKETRSHVSPFAEPLYAHHTGRSLSAGHRIQSASSTWCTRRPKRGRNRSL